jgi:hypothetical protein
MIIATKVICALFALAIIAARIFAPMSAEA